MTASTTLVQARLPLGDLRRLDEDVHALGLANRSEAVRAALRLLHKHAAQQVLAREYDEFYGVGVQAPVGDVTFLGDEVAGEVMTEDH